MKYFGGIPLDHFLLYPAIGEQRLHELVDHFYNHVSKHPLLAPIFPTDLTETARKQKLFLTQFFGGPALYSLEFGAPMLRARHLPFPITPERAEAWLQCMQEAMKEVGLLDEELGRFMLERLTKTAHHMVNTESSL